MSCSSNNKTLNARLLAGATLLQLDQSAVDQNDTMRLYGVVLLT